MGAAVSGKVAKGTLTALTKMDWNMHLFIQKPVYQALLFLLLTPILIFAIRPKSADTAWAIAVYTFALFLVINAGLLWFDDSPWRYALYSIGSSVAYLVCIAILMAGMLRVLQLKGAEEGAMAFLIVIYQPFALLLVILAKWIAAKWF